MHVDSSFVILQIPTWKRNILRLIIVLIAGSLAVLLKDNFAYVGAFVGKYRSAED